MRAARLRRRRLCFERLDSRVVLSGDIGLLADVTVDEDAPDTVIDLATAFDDPSLGLGDSLNFTATVGASIESLVAQVSQTSYTRIHQDLLYTHLGDNRGVNGPEHDLARDNIAAYFAELGLQTSLEPFLFSFVYPALICHNVVGIHPGVTRPDDVYLVGAHYDSVDNPGADDNASGVAAVMEIARVLSPYTFDATLVFVAFDREEQGKYGSLAYTNAHPMDHIVGMLSLDMIAYNDPGAGRDTVQFFDAVPGGVIKSHLAEAFARYGGGLATIDAGRETRSDHHFFEQKGVDAALVNEYAVASNPYYHRAGDAVESADYLDYAYATKITGGVLGYLATAAGWQAAADLLTMTVSNNQLMLDYTPDAHGTVDISVRATDAQNRYVEDTFRVTVNPVNDPPAAGADEFSTGENEMLTVSACGVLANDRDVDGDPLTAILVKTVSHGVLTLAGDGGFTYAPRSQFNREDDFTYVVSDGLEVSEPVTVQIVVDTAYPWHNGLNPLNVNDDALVTPVDALQVINAMIRGEAGLLPPARPRPLGKPFYDVNRDGHLSPIDALQVINHLNRGGGEGESGDNVAAEAAMLAGWPPGTNHGMQVAEATATASARQTDDVRTDDRRARQPACALLDLLFAQIGDVPHSRTQEFALGHRKTAMGDLEEYLREILDGERPCPTRAVFSP